MFVYMLLVGIYDWQLLIAGVLSTQPDMGLIEKLDHFAPRIIFLQIMKCINYYFKQEVKLQQLLEITVWEYTY